VLAAVRAVAAGMRIQPQYHETAGGGVRREARRRGVEDSYDLLSVREKEILHVLASGKSNREIADLLTFPFQPWRRTEQYIPETASAQSAELILYAVRKGLIS